MNTESTYNFTLRGVGRLPYDMSTHFVNEARDATSVHKFSGTALFVSGDETSRMLGEFQWKANFVVYRVIE